MTTTAPFWTAELCCTCHAALIGSEIPTGQCGHCARRFVAPAGKPTPSGPASVGRWGRRPFQRLRFWKVAK